MMDLCQVFMMDDSSSSEESDLEDLLDGEIEQMVVFLTARELEDGKKKKRLWPAVGKPCIPCNRVLGQNMLMPDYFTEVPTYLDHLFCRRYRIRQSLFNKIVATCKSKTCYFKRKRNAASLIRFSGHQNISAVMRVLAYGIPAAYADEYLRIGEDTAMESMHRFCKVMICVYSLTYLRDPNDEDTVMLMQMNEVRG